MQVNVDKSGPHLETQRRVHDGDRCPLKVAADHTAHSGHSVMSLCSAKCLYLT